MQKSIYVMMFLTGLGGGFGHCIGMCGPMVAAYSIRISRPSVVSHLLYNAGRLFTYIFLGAAVGLAGSFLNIVSHIESVQKVIMVIAGLLIILMGISMAGVFRGLINRIENNPLLSIIERLTGFINSGLTEGALFPLGIVMGFIPCGLVYTSLLVVVRASMETALHTRAMLQGAVLMGVFGLGTMPALVVFGRAVVFLKQRMREQIYRLSSLLVVALGVYFLLRALGYLS